MNDRAHQALHVDLISLQDATGEAAKVIVEAAGELTEMELVLEAGAIEGRPGSDFDLAVYFLLPSSADIEPFGTDARYVRFLQGTVAPKLTAFGGASVRLEGVFPAQRAYGACLTVEAPEETYDWEVSEKLTAWCGSQPGGGVAGLATGERQRYRGLAFAFADNELPADRPAIGGLDVTFVAGAIRRLG
jgi:hypothetical protein